jgi:hypothetical protein
MTNPLTKRGPGLDWEVSPVCNCSFVGYLVRAYHKTSGKNSGDLLVQVCALENPNGASRRVYGRRVKADWSIDCPEIDSLDIDLDR